MKSPKISILMPSYNAEKYIADAIESILNQTFSDFEFIIINDGSTDKTADIINKYRKIDKRIRFINNNKNYGYIWSLNKCLDVARGEYVAKMDADDISLPKRLEKQVHFLDSNPEIGMVGVGYQAFDKGNFTVIHPKHIGLIELFKTCSTTCIMARSAIIKNNKLRFDSDYFACEDYEFYSRFIKHAKIANLQEVLYMYRWHGENVSIKKNDIQRANTERVRNKILDLISSDKQITDNIKNLLLGTNTNMAKQRLKVFRKEKLPNGRRHIYLGNIKIASYKHKKKSQVIVNPIFDTTPLGKVYKPYYNPVVPINSTEHDIYNKDGQKMRTFFIRDVHLACEPANESKYFIWDRFNIGLKTHFYSHNSMLETMGNPDKRYGFLIETEGIVPEDYKIFDKNPELYKDFDLIFTHSADILNKLPNARFVPLCASLYNSNFAPQNQWQNKMKDISILSSAKQMCDLHKFRLNLAMECKHNGWADTYGTFDGGQLVPIADTLRDYRYSICIENIVTPYLFTERLICAFANQTIPIYLGATDIDKFFNPDGIIKINTASDIEHVLKQCTPQEYLRRKDAILDNYERAKEYENPWDYMYIHYLQ